MSYFDYEALNAETSFSARRKMFGDTYFDTNRFRQQVYNDYIASHGYTTNEIARLAETSPDIVSRLKERKFTCGTAIMQKICFNVLHMSSQEFLFDEPEKISVVPRRFHLLISMMQDMDEETRAKFATKLQERVQSYINTLKSERRIVYEPSVMDLINDRFWEIGNEWGVHPTNMMFGTQGPSFRAQVRAVLAKSRNITVPTLMYLAWQTGVTIDYLWNQDYTVYGNVGYKNPKTGRVVKLRDRSIIAAIGALLAVSPDEQCAFIGELQSKANPL